MSGSDSYPPPGAPQPGGHYPPPGTPASPPGGQSAYPPAGYPAGYPGGPPAGYYPPSMAAAHKPGAIPLRPLGLGDMYDAAFKIIRFNPKATVGSSVIVSSVAMLIPVIITAVASFTVGLSASTFDGTSDPVSTTDLAAVLGAYGALILGLVLSSIGMLMVTGMNAHVALAAATGRKLSLGEAWAATHGKRWRLLGLTAVVFLGTLSMAAVIVGLVITLGLLLDTALTILTSVLAVLVFLALMIWLWVRVYYLAVPPLMLEPVGIFGALGRAFRLTRSQFWRTFGIALLTLVITQLAGGILSTPVALVGELFLAADPQGLGVFIFVLANAVGSVLAAAIVSPFVTTVTSLQYLDQRIRKEAFDLELMSRAGIIDS